MIFTHRRLHRQIVAQPVVVVESFVALEESERPLPQHLLRRVLHQVRGARIMQRLRHRLWQSEPPFDLAQQQQPAIGADLTAIKADINSRAAKD